MIGVLALVAAGVLAASKKEPITDFTRWDALIHANSSQFGVPWRYIKAIMTIESNLGQAESVATGLADPNDIEGSRSGDGISWGLMQTTLPISRYFRPGTTSADLNNPEISVSLGTQYLKYCLDKFPGDLQGAIRAYNGGEFWRSKAPDVQARSLRYWNKFQAALSDILAQQPGNETEIG